MTVRHKISTKNLENLLFYSFRYALGRSTYATYDVTTALIKYKDALNRCTKDLILKEIDEAIASNKAGMKCDVDCWAAVLEELMHE